MEMIKVAIVDDEEAFCEGIQALMRDTPDIMVEGYACTAAAFLKLLEGISPEIAIIDVRLPDMDGITLVALLREKFQTIKVLIYSATVDEKRVLTAATAGAKGYVGKANNCDELRKALRCLHAGGIYYDNKAAAFISIDHHKRILAENTLKPDHSNYLTGREIQILIEKANGLTNEEIGKKLFISKRTVEHHLTAIADKLGCENQADLLKYALCHGYAKFY